MKKKRWQQRQIFLINADIFKVDVVIAVDSTEADAVKWMKKNAHKRLHEQLAEKFKGWDEDCKGDCEGRMFETGGGFFVFIRSNESWVKTFGTLVHEMTHVTHYLLRNRRMPLSEDTEETYAYLIEYLMSEAARKML